MTSIDSNNTGKAACPDGEPGSSYSDKVTDVRADSRIDEPYAKPLYRGYVLAILTLVYTFNFLDRQLLVILQEPIKAELGLSDTQLGLLSGFAFAVFYVVCGIPIARWADKGTRRSIVSLALAIWSFMTAISGFVQSYTHLLLARIGVGVGEAGGSPPSHSMISDIFPEEKRATALSIYSIGSNLGILAGFLLGGWIGELFGWRVAFIIVGIPGILLAVLVRFTVKEPARGWSQKSRAGASTQPGKDDISLMGVIKLLWSRPSFRHLSIASALQAFVGFATYNWLASYFLRTFDIGIGALGTWLALSSGIVGAMGTFMGGYLTDRLGKTEKRWYFWIPACGILAFLPVSWTVLNAGNMYVGLALSGMMYFCFSIYLGPMLAMTHGLVGLRMRAVASAVLFFIINLVGMGLGPTTVGFLSDQFMASNYDPSTSLRYALMVTVAVGTIWSALHYFMATKTIKEDLKNAPA